MERRLSGQTETTQGLWRGTKSNFQKKVDNGEIIDGWIYYVSESESDGKGFQDGENGFIAVGKKNKQYVTFSGKGEKGDPGEPGKDGKDGVTPNLDAVYAELATKTSKTSIVSFYKAAYSDNHAAENEYQRILSIKPNTILTMNVMSSCFGSTAQNTIWFSGQADACLFSVFGTDFVWEKSNGRFNLLTPTLKYNTPAVPTYYFQIVQLYGYEDCIEWYTTENTYTTANKVNSAKVVWRNEPPTREDSVSFDIKNGTSSLSMGTSLNFIGDVKDSGTTAEITVSTYAVDKIYQFTFTKKLTSIVLKNSRGVEFCTIDETINQGDVVTITTITNTTNGWIYSTTKPSIAPGDESIEIEWIDGVAYIKSNAGKTTNSEDLTDVGYKVMTNVQQISQTSGKPTVTNFLTGKISFLKEKQIVLKEYFDKWIDLFVPWIVSKAKEKKTYYIINTAKYNIPSDADIVVLRRDDFPDDTEEMSQDYIDVILPATAQTGKRIDIICTNFSKQTQKSILLYVKAQSGYYSEGSGYLYMLYQGVVKTFIFDGNASDYNGGWLYK